jgi:Zn-finger nucleic acid-binding protein
MAKDSKKPEKKPASKPAAKVREKPQCPRCKISLGADKYEGVNVDFCDTCWGHWVGIYQFETILASKDEVFSKEERQSSAKAPAHPADGKPLTCARCDKGMQKLMVKDEWDKAAFFVDYCKDHGLWLDTGEIKRAQILDERTGGNVRKALETSVGKGIRPSSED